MNLRSLRIAGPSLLVIGAWVVLNEQPTLGTQGSFPTGICVELLPEDLLASTVHRGWPYSFYCSYFVDGKVVIQYFTYSLWWNAAALVAALVGVLAVMLGVIRWRGSRR